MSDNEWYTKEEDVWFRTFLQYTTMGEQARQVAIQAANAAVDAFRSKFNGQDGRVNS